MSRPDPPGGRLLAPSARVAFSLLLLALVAALGQLPYGRPSGDAVVRLALRSTSTRVEICRPPTSEELATLPVHMRPSEICDVIAPPYRLRLAVDGRPVLDRIVEAGGLKADRPRIVDERIVLAPGRVFLEVTYEPAAGGGEATAERPPSYHLAEEVELVPDRVTLIELDDDRGLYVYRVE